MHKHCAYGWGEGKKKHQIAAKRMHSQQKTWWSKHTSLCWSERTSNESVHTHTHTRIHSTVCVEKHSHIPAHAHSSWAQKKREQRLLTVFRSLSLSLSHTHTHTHTQSVSKLASAKHIAPAPSGSASKRELGVLIAKPSRGCLGGSKKHHRGGNRWIDMWNAHTHTHTHTHTHSDPRWNGSGSFSPWAEGNT